MKITSEKPIIIFSCLRPSDAGTLNADIKVSECEQALYIAGVQFKRVEGCFQGNKETSFVVPAVHEKFIRKLCDKYNQEYYLFINKQRQATLISHNSTRVIGKFVRICKHELSTYDSWTYDSAANQYWAVTSWVK